MTELKGQKPVTTHQVSALAGNTITSKGPSSRVEEQSQKTGEQNQVQAPSANLETQRPEQKSQEEILKRAAENAARLRSEATRPADAKVIQGFAQTPAEALKETNRTEAEKLAQTPKQSQINLQPLFVALENNDTDQVNRELNKIAGKYSAKLNKIRDQEEFVLFVNAKHSLEEDQILADNILGLSRDKKIGFAQTKPDFNVFHGVLFANKPEAKDLQKQLVQVSVQKLVLQRANAQQKTLLEKLVNNSSKAPVEQENRSLLRQISENIGSIIQNFLKGLLRFTEIIKGGEKTKAV
jgi:hypothetical protein